MEHLGLIENTGIGPVKGAPNAWGLTARGRRSRLRSGPDDATVSGIARADRAQ